MPSMLIFGLQSCRKTNHLFLQNGVDTKVQNYVMFPLIFFFVYFLGVFIARGKEDALVTRNIAPGETVYGEKKISVDVCCQQMFVQALSYT